MDYNIPGAIWFNDDLGRNVNYSTHSSAIALRNSFCYHNPHHLNTISNNMNISLDLIFSRMKDLYAYEPLDLLFANNVHNTSITCNLKFDTEMKFQYEEYYYDLKHGNYFVINNFLVSIGWSIIVGNISNIDHVVQNL